MIASTDKGRAMKGLVISLITVAGLALPSAASALTEAEALTTALTRAIPKRATQVASSGPSTLRRAESVLGGEETHIQGAEETAFPFAVTNSGGETYKPMFSPPGQEARSFPYMSVVVTTKWTTTTLSLTPPLISRLGTVVTLNLPNGAAAAMAKSCRVDELLHSALAAKHLHAREASAARALKACEARHR